MILLLLDLIELAYGVLNLLSLYEPASWGYAALYLLTSVQKVDPLLTLTCCVLPILSPIVGLVGLWIDQKKVFSVLGLILTFVSYLLAIAYILNAHI